jgi:hypothetical protein
MVAGRSLPLLAVCLFGCAMPNRRYVAPAPLSGCWAVSYAAWSVPLADSIATLAPPRAWLDTAVAYEALHVAKTPANPLWSAWQVERFAPEDARISLSVPVSATWNYLFRLHPTGDSLVGWVEVTDADLDSPHRTLYHTLAYTCVTLRRLPSDAAPNSCLLQTKAPAVDS